MVASLRNCVRQQPLTLMNKLVEAWENDSISLDLLLGAATAVAALVLCSQLNLFGVAEVELRRTFYSTIATAFASVLGFNVTAVSILALVSQSEALKLLRQSRPEIYRRLIGTFLSTVYASVLALIVAVAALLSDGGTSGRFGVFSVSLVAAFGIVRLLRSVSRLSSVLYLS